MPKTLVKLRRTPSDAPRPASTPPVIAASAIQDEDDEEKIIAELENSINSPGPTKGPTVAARLRHLQQGSLERPKTRGKQKEDIPKVQGQQQC